MTLRFSFWSHILVLFFSGCALDFPVNESTDASADSDTDESNIPNIDSNTESNADQCPNDPNKTLAGICGCGVPDEDNDGDGTFDCYDSCPADSHKNAPGACGCGAADADGDQDGTADCIDSCPGDAKKIVPGICGCGASDADRDGDGTADCLDSCPNDAGKVAPGLCGCGIVELDRDEDGTLDCKESCPSDPNKTVPGACGCNVSDADSDGDGVPDCNVSPLSYVAGLERVHRIDNNKDGVFETEVCEELKYAWFDDEFLTIAGLAFGFRYQHGDTPCTDIDIHDRWTSIFEGFLYLTTADGSRSSHEVGFVADVNDGVRLAVMNPEGTAEICRMELWQDVPEYNSYHSTDGYPVDYCCKTTLTAGVFYPMKLEVYHESAPYSSNPLFNRAYLDMFYNGVPTGGSIEFYRADP